MLTICNVLEPSGACAKLFCVDSAVNVSLVFEIDLLNDVVF